MLIHPEKKVAFILHPRTASHSTAVALRAIGFIDSGPNHQIDSEWAKYADSVACTVRNPFDVIVSWYFYQHGGRTLKQYLKDWPNQWARNGMFYGLMFCDTVIHYERLDFELNEWLKSIELPEVTLPRENVTKPRMTWEQAMTGYSATIRICDTTPREGRFHL